MNTEKLSYLFQNYSLDAVKLIAAKELSENEVKCVNISINKIYDSLEKNNIKNERTKKKAKTTHNTSPEVRW